MVVFALFTLGLFTRVTSILSLLTAVSYANRVPAALFGLDQINIMLNVVPGHRPERCGLFPRPLAGAKTIGLDRARRGIERAPIWRSA